MDQSIQKGFKINETRALSLRAERLDPAHLDDGKAPAVSAVQTHRRNHPWGQARHYRLNIEGQTTQARVQINGFWVGAEDDEALLAEMAEQALAPMPEAVKPVAAEAPIAVKDR